MTTIQETSSDKFDVRFITAKEIDQIEEAMLTDDLEFLVAAVDHIAGQAVARVTKNLTRPTIRGRRRP